MPTGADRWALGEHDLHLRFEAGAGTAELDLTRLLKALGVIGTARNLRTVDRMIQLAATRAAAGLAPRSTDR